MIAIFKLSWYTIVMVNLGNDEIVKYPFLTEAGKYLNDLGFSLEQFGILRSFRVREKKKTITSISRADSGFQGFEVCKIRRITCR